MGIFSSKRKTYVGTSSSRLIEDSMVPNSIQTGTVKAIMNDGDISKYVIQDLSQSFGTKARSMYNFGRNNYSIGTPDAQIHTSTVGSAEVLAVLTGFYPGQTVEMVYNHLGAPNILHIGWFKLMQSHGYDPQTNKLGGLTTSTGRDVFLHDLVVVLPLASAGKYSGFSVEQWGVAARAGTSPTRPGLVAVLDPTKLLRATAIESSPTATEDHVRVEYAWKDAGGTTQQGSFIIGNSEFDEAADYFHVCFKLDGVRRFWMYQPGLGTYPTLDAIGDTSGPGETLGSFFPLIHFRNNKQSLAANTSSEEFLDSKKMAKKLGVDYMQVHDAIHENPDIGDVAQAYLGLMVPALSTDPLDRRYLFDFFGQMLETEIGIPTPPVARVMSRESLGVERAAILIQDKKVKHTLSTTGITRRLVVGVLEGGVEYTSGYVNTGEKHHYYHKQVTATVYEEIKVFGLEMRYWVDGNYSAVGDEEDAELLIPVDYSIGRKYPLQLQEKLYSRSLRLICNSSITVKVKWYQRGAFAVFLQIVGIAMVIYDGGLTLALVEAGLTTFTAIIAAVVITQIVQIGISLAFKFVAKVLGPELAFLAASAMAFYGGYKAFQQGISTALPEVTTLLQTAIGLVQGASLVVMEDLVDMKKSFDAFAKESEEKMTLLEEAQKLLDSSARLSPLVIFGETPENYYNRTVHSGNVGIIGYTAIDSYVDMALTLPKLSDTLGGDVYAL